MSTTVEPIATKTPPPPINLDAFETRAIALAELHESPKNPRRYYNETRLDELAASIRAEGLRVAIVARPRLEADGYEIAAGHRRYRAAKRAGVELVPVQIRDMTDLEFIDWLAFENDHREDLNALEQAQGWQLWMDENAASIGDLIKARNLKPAYVYQRIKLLEAIPDAQRAYVDGRIKIGHLEDIARLGSHKDQRAALKALEPAQWDPEKQLTTREFKAWIRKNLHVDLTEAYFPLVDADLLPNMGDCGPCVHRLGNAPDFDPDVDLPQICTQAECYEAKTIEFVNREMARLRGQVVFVSERATTNGEGVVPKGDWFEVAGNVANSKEAFIVEGPHMGRKLRVVVQERLAPPPPKPAPAAKPSAPPAASVTIPVEPIEEKLRRQTEERERQRKIEADEAAEDERLEREEMERRARFEREEKLRFAILRETLPRIKWPLRPVDLLPLLPSEGAAELPEALDPFVREFFGERVFGDLSTLGDTQLAQFFAIFIVSDEFESYAINHGCDRLHAFAKRVGVDVDAIRNAGKEAEGGTRREVVKNLPALGAGKRAAAKKAPAKKAAAKKSAPKKKAAKPAAKKKGGKK